MEASLFVDLLGLIVALAAFLLSAAALYLTSLRRADVELDYLPSNSRVDGDWPANVLDLGVFVTNSGVRGGVLEEVRIESLADRRPALWTKVQHTSASADGGTPVRGLVLMAGEGRQLRLTGNLEGAPLTSQDRAEAVAALRLQPELEVQVRWTFVRTSGLLPRRKRTRKPHKRETTIRVDIRDLANRMASTS
jgi:hypothetical protein